MHCRRTLLTMLVVLLLSLPLLMEVVAHHHHHHHDGDVGCVLQPASTEKFFFTSGPKTWYQQYVYRVPGIYDLGCITYYQYPGKRPNEVNFNGTFSRVPKFPMSGITIAYGNRLIEVYHGVWNCYLSGPLNLVFSHQDFIIGHRCLIGHDFAEIYTTVKKPNKELKELIWKVVANHTEVDRHKFKKAIC